MSLSYRVNSPLEEWREIRERVFMDEQGYVEEFDTLDSNATHITVYDEGKVVGCARILTTDIKGYLKVGRIAVLKDARSKGYGAYIMQVVEKEARMQGANALGLDAQEYAIGFYNKCGYTESGELFEDEGQPHMYMKKEIL